MSEELTKLDLLIKVMKMTTAEDGPALVAVRKANALLNAEGWDWERLLRGKVKIIQDPFASVPRAAAPAPVAKPAARHAPPPPPPPPPPSHAANPFGGMSPPKPKPAQPKPQNPSWHQPPPPKQAPAGPLHFRRASSGEWAIASHIKIDSMIGQMATLEKRDGSKSDETIGPFIEQSPSGHYLYKIAKASKFKRKYADVNDINNIF